MVSRKSLLALLGVGVSAFVLSAAGALAADKHIEQLSQAASASTAENDANANVAIERARRIAAEKMVAELQAENQETDEKFAAAQKKLETVSIGKAKPGASAKELQAYQSQIADLNAQISQLAADRAQSNAKIQSLQKQLQVTQQDVINAGNSQEMQQQADIERARRQAAERALAETQSATHDREQQVNQLQKQLQVTQQDVINAKKTQVPANDPQAAVEKARRQATEAALQKARDAATAADAENIRLAKANATMKQQMSQLQATASDNKMAQVSGQLATLEQRNADLMAQLQAAKTQNEAAAKATVMTTSNDAATNQRIAEIGKKAAADHAEFQALLEAETSRRQKLEAMLAQGGDTSGKMDEVTKQVAALTQQNADLQKRLVQEQAASALPGASNTQIADLQKQLGAMKSDNAMLAQKLSSQSAAAATASTVANSDQMAAMQKQLSVMKADNEMLAGKLASAANAAKAGPAGADNSAQIADLQKQLSDLKNANDSLSQKLQTASASSSSSAATPTVYNGDDQIAGALAETKSSLASVTAERDEYRNLLQRERLAEKEGKGKTGEGDDSATNARIASLETERADLVKKLEFEKSKNTSGIPGASSAPVGVDTGAIKEMQDKLASVQAEKDKLQKQLQVTQQDVINARMKAQAVPAQTAAVSSVPSADVQALIEENQKLQTELAAGSRASVDPAVQSEIASLRAQNNVLSSEMNKRLAGAPDRAAMDNAAAEANYKVKQVQAASTNDVLRAQDRFHQAEAENIRLAKALAAARAANTQPAPMVAAPVVASTQMAPIPAQAQSTLTAGQISNPPAAPLMVVATTQSVQAQPPMQQQTVQQQPAMAPAPMVPMSQTMAQPVAYMPSAPVNAGPNGSDISNYLKRAGIPMVSGFEKVNKVSSAQFGAFRWDTGVVFGTAEQQIMPDIAGFEQAVNTYLTKTRERCSGTFDQSFDPGQMAQHRGFAVADVACIMPDGTGAGAAMVFYYKDGTFNVVAHEGDITQFDQAMSTRDLFAKFMQGVL